MTPEPLTPLAAYVRAKMTERAIPSAGELGRRAGLSRVAVLDILNGETTNPSTRALCALATGLGVDVRELMPAACATARLDEAA